VLTTTWTCTIDTKRRPSYHAAAMPDQPPRRAVLGGLLVCFFLSGAAGLIYQVAWGKALGLVFGHTAYAVATVLAVFMGGLAAGSAWLGRWSERTARPIALYGWIETGVAATGAVSLAGIGGVRAAYVAAYPLAAGHGALLVALRFVGAGLVLFLPTFLMGGTLPVLVRGLARKSGDVGTRLARLYWVNTAGAAAGTLAAGFVILPMLGMQLTLAIAVTLNLMAAVFALKLSRGEPAVTPVSSTRVFWGLPTENQTSSPAVRPRFLLICFAAVGATAMAYEIGWTRLLATQLGSSTYAFSLMLATFLTGIVLGSALFEVWSRRYQASQMTFALTQTFTAVTAFGFLISFPRLIEVLPPILRASHGSFRGLVLAQFVLCALAILPVAVVFGFNFPAVTLLIAGRQSSSGSGSAEMVGRAYAWNMLGAIVGALATGFWLLPKLGSFHVLAATAAANLALAALLSVVCAPRGMLAFAGNILLLIAVVVIGFSNYFYDPSVAAFNTVLYWNHFDRPLPLTLREKARLMDVLYLADGLNSTITVTQTDDYISLRTNGKVDASNHDVITQLLLGDLGALSHPPRRVLVIGFGGGMTASALARYPELERLDCVEIEPAVVGAAPLLGQLNRNVLQDSRVHVIFDDARNFLFTSRDQYDLIVSEPSNPWIAGVATLFTREFYRAAQARLAPGGAFVQWVQAYSLFPDDLRMVLATFLSEFQGATLWHGDAPDLILMAPSGPTTEILNRTQALYANPSLHEDFKRLGMDEPAGLFGFYMLDDAGLRTFSLGARMNTDDLTLLEYHAPRSLLVQGLEENNRRDIFLAQKDVLPADFPENMRDAALAAAAATSLNVQDKDGADHFVRALENRPVTANIATVRGRVALVHSNFEDAYRAFDAALAIDPNSIEAAWGRGETDRRLGNLEKAHQEFLRILERDPTYLRALESLKQLAKDSSHWPEAEYFQLRLITSDPHSGAGAYAELAELFLRVGDLDHAYRAMQDCLARDPYNFQTRINFGELLSHQKRWAEARQHLEFVRRYFPDGDAGTYTLLYEVDSALGDPRAAADAVRFGLRMFPDNSDLLRLNLLL
jgi:spermidine synthase